MSLKHIAKEVLNLIKRGNHVADDQTVIIRDEIRAAIEGSRIYTPDQLAELRDVRPTGSAASIEVVNGTSQQVGHSMAKSKGLVLLNFASARNPGGGFLNGAKAQEEDLCRCSALYPALSQQREYYEANRNQSSLLYTDYAIFSPNVPFFRTHGTGDLLTKPFLSSVITAPAPNTKPYLAKSGNRAM